MENKNAITENVISVGEILISAISAGIKGEKFEFPQETDFEKLYKLAFNHRVAANIAPVVVTSALASDEIKSKFKKELFRTAARFDAQAQETKKISDAFSEKSIRHCFLKGIKVCDFYDRPETRFMLDMDVFVETEKFAEAENILERNGYEKSAFGDDKDTGYVKKPFFNIELHKELKYDYDKGYEYYKGASERMVSENGFALNMTNEDFYVYILSHTAHHFEVSGTGIKNVIDHYYLNKKLLPLCDKAVLRESLEKIGLTVFAERLDSLCRFWFEGEAQDEAIEKMAEFVILSGVFGNETNQYFSGISRGEYENKKSSYFLARLFPSAKALRPKYPVLEKAPFLLPLFWIVRIISSVFNAGRIKDEAKSVSAADTEKYSQHKIFMENMGL